MLRSCSEEHRRLPHFCGALARIFPDLALRRTCMFPHLWRNQGRTESGRSTVCPTISLDCSHSVQVALYVRLSKVFCEEVRWVLFSRDFQKLEHLIPDMLLDPQKMHLQMAEFAQSGSGCDSDGCR